MHRLETTQLEATPLSEDLSQTAVEDLSQTAVEDLSQTAVEDLPRTAVEDLPRTAEWKPMRFLFLVDLVYEDMPGGSRVVAMEEAKRLVQRGHEVTLLAARRTPEAPALEVREGVRIVRYGGAGNAAQFIRQGWRACAQLVAATQYDVVVTHFAYAALGPLQAVNASIPRLRVFHGPWDDEGWAEDQATLLALPASQSSKRRLLGLKGRLKRAVRGRVETWNLRQSQKVVVLSRYMLAEVVGRGLSESAVSVIPGGTNVEKFVPASDKGAVRATLGLPLDRPLLLSVRRLTRRMGLDQLLQAMPAVIAQCPDVLLLLGGQGPERVRLEQMVRDLGLGAHVQLLGFIPDADLVQYYQAADLFVLPTIALEGFGLVTTEALACGLPVVGTPVGATPEILGRLDERLITAGVSPEDLAQAITAYLETGGSWGLSPERLRAYVLEHYTWERHVDAMEVVAREMTQSRRGSRS